MSKIHNLIIIGSGPAGYSACIYAQRAGLNPLLISGYEVGGQLMQTTHIDNYAGVQNTTGPQLMEIMKSQIDSLGVISQIDHIENVDFTSSPYKLIGQNNTYLSHAVIIATGSSAKWLNCIGENTFKGFGVSSCATCDGFFFKNQDVAVIGGGNTAIEEAIYLSNIAKKVFLIHRRDSLRGEKIMQNKLFNTPNVEIIYDTIVEEMCGEDNNNSKSLTHLKLKNTKTNGISSLNISGAFVAIGHNPNTSFLKNAIDLDNDGYIELYKNTTHVLKNNIPLSGVFACGDVADKIYRQAITSAGSGCKASLDAQHYINNMNLLNK